MALNLVVNGVTYQYPETGDETWGDQATSWAQAITNGVLQKSGGLFQLTADVDFGSTKGLTANYFNSRTTTISTAGVLRLAKTDSIGWRNNANGGNLILGIAATDRLQYAGIDLVDLSSSQTLTNKSMSGSSNTFTNIGDGALTTPYIKADGTRGLSGNWNAGNFSITASGIVIGLATNQIGGVATITNGGTLTLPTSTDVLVGRDTTDTLTNKTLSAAIATGQFKVADGSGANPGIAWSLETNTGWARTAANQIDFFIGGNAATRVSASAFTVFSPLVLQAQNGIALSSGVITVPDGSASAPGYSFGSETTTGFTRDSGSGVSFVGASATQTRFIIDAQGTNANSLLLINTKNGTGDSILQFAEAGTPSWSLGRDDSDSSAFIIAASSALGTSNAFKITTGGAVTIGGTILTGNHTSSAFISQTANPAAAGALRLANSDAINFRNSGNSADISLATGTSNSVIAYAGIDLVNLSTAQTLTNKTISGSSNTLSNIADGSLSTSYIKADGTRVLSGVCGVGASNAFAGFSVTPASMSVALTSTNQEGYTVEGAFAATATNSVTGFNSAATTTASAYTLSVLQHFVANNSTAGAGSTITRQISFRAVQPTGGSNNAAFSDNSAFTGNYFINQSGTASSVFGGQMSIGAAGAATSGYLYVGNQSASAGILTTTNQQGIAVDYTVSSNATVGAQGVDSFVRTANTSFTCPVVSNFKADTISKGAASTITRTIQYEASGDLTVGTNNAQYADNESFVGNWAFNVASVKKSNFSGPFTLTLSDTSTGTATGFRLTGSSTGFTTNTSQYSFYADPVFNANATVEGYHYAGQLQTANSVFTLPFAATFYSLSAGKGAASTITRLANFYGVTQTVGTNNAWGTDNQSFSGSYVLNFTSTNSSVFAGPVSTQLGGASATRRTMNTIANANGDSGNVSTGETSIQGFTVPASTLGTDNDALYYEVVGTFAANANNKRIRIVWDDGGVGTTAIDTGSLAFNGTNWKICVTVQRTGSATQRITGEFSSGDTVLRNTVNYVTGSTTLSGSVLISTYATGGASNDIIRKAVRTMYWPAT
jgi:hypothetical protein